MPCGAQWKAVAGERVMSHTTATLQREEEGRSASLLPIATLTLSPCSPWKLTLRLSSIGAISFPSLCAVCLSLVLPGSLCHSWKWYKLRLLLYPGGGTFGWVCETWALTHRTLFPPQELRGAQQLASLLYKMVSFFLTVVLK